MKRVRAEACVLSDQSSSDEAEAHSSSSHVVERVLLRTEAADRAQLKRDLAEIAAEIAEIVVAQVH